MKIRWRQHEVIFVTLAGLLLMVQFVFTGLGEARQILTEQGIPDAGWRLITSYFVDRLFLPQVGPFLIVYVFYLITNLYVIPVIFFKRRHFFAGILLSIGIWMLLLFAFAFTYYKEDVYYAVRFSAHAANLHSFKTAVALLVAAFLLYGLYVYIREAIIKWLYQKQTNRAFAISLTNHITGVWFLYLGVMALLYSFDSFRNDAMATFYVFFLLPGIVVCFINIYRLFPLQRKKMWSFKQLAKWLVVSPTLFTAIVFMAFLNINLNTAIVTAPMLWFALTLIATPVSWLLYVQQREKLESMLNLQLSLGKTSANLQFLRSQINPHFLFNALNTIYGTALQENADRTSEAVQRLGEMMRFMLEENQQDRISLDKELNYLTNYIDLQKLRTIISPDIEINFTNQTQHCNHLIAPMLLIPFVENAFKHGISLNEKSWIKINISCDDKAIYFDVYNSVHPRITSDPEKNRSGIGLENVKRRLSLIYPNRHELHIRATHSEYFVHLTLKP